MSNSTSTSTPTELRHGVHWARAQALLQHEVAAFSARNPSSRALSERAQAHLLFGVPLHWMTDWGTPFALQVAQAQGARLLAGARFARSQFC